MLDGPMNASPEILKTVKHALTGDYIKMLNLCHDWLKSFLPHVLAKINRVSFGLLSAEDLEKAKDDPRMPKSRKLLAVPFVGKDVPSRASEFSHPDVVIGLTILAYRYEGLRPTDFDQVLRRLRKEMMFEGGPYVIFIYYLFSIKYMSGYVLIVFVCIIQDTGNDELAKFT